MPSQSPRCDNLLPFSFQLKERAYFSLTWRDWLIATTFCPQTPKYWKHLTSKYEGKCARRSRTYRKPMLPYVTNIPEEVVFKCMRNENFPNHNNKWRGSKFKTSCLHSGAIMAALEPRPSSAFNTIDNPAIYVSPNGLSSTSITQR